MLKYLTIFLLIAFPATAGNLQGQLQGQKQGQAQLQGQGQIAVGAVKTNVSTNTDVDAEPAYAPNPAVFRPTVRCKLPGSLTGGGGGFFSFGIAGSLTDENCERIEKAKACTNALASFPQFKARCAELWAEAFMTDDERTAHNERRNAIALKRITFYRGQNGSVEEIAWAGDRAPIE